MFPFKHPFLTKCGQAVRKAHYLLEVILHIGAHRTGTTSLQSTLKKNQYNLKKTGLSYWGPDKTRDGLFSGLMHRPDQQDEPETKKLVQRNQGLIRLEMDRLARQKQKRLLISEENIMGATRNNLRALSLYPLLRERLEPYCKVFAGQVARVALAIRPYEDYWASIMAYAIPAGHRALKRDELDAISAQRRSWRRVITDVAASFPSSDIAVLSFDRLIGKPASQFRILTGGLHDAAFRPYAEKRNVSANYQVLRRVLNDRGDHDAAERLAGGNGRFQPFDAAQIAEMQIQYTNDLAWLRRNPPGRIQFFEQAEGLRHFATGYDKRGTI